MWWRAIFVIVLTVVVFLITGIFASSPSLLGGTNGLVIVLAAVLAAGGVGVGIRHYRENKRLQSEVSKWKARVQGRIWRGY